jgi:hypothetical protein
MVREQGVFLTRLSDLQSDFHDKESDSFQQNDHNRQQGKDTGIFEASDFGFGKDVEPIFGGGVDPLGSWTKGFQSLVSGCAADDFIDQPRELVEGHMRAVAMIVDPVWTERSVGLDALIG